MSDDIVENENRPVSPNDDVLPRAIGFTADEMVSCGRCGKANPPNRLKCFYCASELELPVGSTVAVRLNLRTLEKWERGLNVIINRNDRRTIEPATERLCNSVGLDAALLSRILASGSALPFVRVESVRESDIVVGILAEAGIDAIVVGDSELSSDILPVRLRSIRFLDGQIEFTAFNGDNTFVHDTGEIEYAVLGMIVESQIEATTRKKKGEVKTLEESATSSDQLVVDIYSSGHDPGFRIPTTGFDFSCLGNEKGLLAADNLEKLLRLIEVRCPDASIDRSYRENRSLLDLVWEPERTRHSAGFQRSGFGRKDLAHVDTTNNLEQFTRYSRMLRHLK